MSPADILARYDAEIRADPPAEVGVERVWAGGVLRTIGAYSFIGWWDFPQAEAAAVVARESAYFRSREGDVEWKVFGHDRPPGLEQRLAEAGWNPEEPETFLVFDVEARDLSIDPPTGVEVRRVTDAAGVADLIAANELAFGQREGWRQAALEARLGDPTVALYVAYSDGAPISSGRLEMSPGRAFAGLYGGGTAPRHRGRGVYRALVAARAAEAKRRGFRFLTVDARETSRPIIERLGFQPLTGIRGWVLQGRPAT
ncbi:MAG: GNAT family N-acetyltransferase [Caulobacterales bacterium]